MSFSRCLSERAGPPSRSPGRRWRQVSTRGPVALLCALTALTALSAAPAVAANPSRHVQSSQSLATLRFEHRAYRSPSTSSRVMTSLPARTAITGEQTTLPVVGRKLGTGGQPWLKVMLPGRPNGSTGWISAGGTTPSVTGWHIFVSTAQRHIWVYLHGRLSRSFAVVVGKASTPTPTGRFFVQETVKMPSTAAGGPFALALSGRSNVLQAFDGGPGQIAIHGRDLLGGTLGQAESHGCVRLATASIVWLAARIGPGIPVTIY